MIIHANKRFDNNIINFIGMRYFSFTMSINEMEGLTSSFIFLLIFVYLASKNIYHYL